MKLKWTIDACRKEAIKYNNKRDFMKSSKNAYSAAHKHGFIDDICSHMRPLGNSKKRGIYSFEFNDGSVYVGLTYDFEKRYNEHISSEKSQVYIHKEKTELTPEFRILNDYTNIDDAIELEGYFISKYRSEGWLILNRSKHGAIGTNTVKWTYNECKLDALKYNDRTSFMRKSPGAYKSASKNKWLDEICSHMIIKNMKWTYDICRLEALKYKTRNEFKNKSCGAYTFSYRNGFLEDICKHMKRYKNNFKLCKF